MVGGLHTRRLGFESQRGPESGLLTPQALVTPDLLHPPLSTPQADPSIVALLLEAGADPEMKDAFNGTALLDACRSGVDRQVWIVR